MLNSKKKTDALPPDIPSIQPIEVKEMKNIWNYK
jgi:hypothetical protein